jgi:pimeloyl-ACP methyl ester carboxylesterase
MRRCDVLTSAGALVLVVCIGCGSSPRSRAIPPAPPPQPDARLIGSTPLARFEQWGVSRADAPDLDVYLARDDVQAVKPLVVFLQGSHCLPLFMMHESDGQRRELSTLLFFETMSSIVPRVHFAVVERRGLRSFGPPPTSEEEAANAAQCTPERGGISKRERVKDAADVIRAFAREPWVGPVLLAGHSEGAYVASGVVRMLGDGSVDALGMLSGPGPTQFFDFIVTARRNGGLGAVKDVFDELIWITGPGASGSYRGAGIERQITYGIDSTNIDDLRDSRVPIFVANGVADDKAPIESADVFVAEMLRDRRRQIRYLMLPDLDHGYRSLRDGADHTAAVLNAFIDWALSPAKGRSVFVGLPANSERSP